MRVGAIVLLAVLLVACSDSNDATSPSVATSNARPPSSDGVATAQPDAVPSAGSDSVAPTLPQDVGGQSLGPLGSTELDVRTDDGRVQIGTADMPELASTVPVPDGLVLLLASERDGSASYSGEAPQGVDDLADLYRRALQESGFEIVAVDRPTAGIAVVSFTGSSIDGELALSESPRGGTSVIVSVNAR